VLFVSMGYSGWASAAEANRSPAKKPAHPNRLAEKTTAPPQNDDGYQRQYDNSNGTFR